MPRKYEVTHPWLKFTVDLSPGRVSARVWMLLGEARSKCEHIGGVPLRPEIAKKLYTVTLAKGVAATTAIEGNTLSAEDVEKRIEGKLQVPQSKAYQVQEVDNILAALNGVIHPDLIRGSLPPLTPPRIRLFNSLVLKGLPLSPEVVPGQVRTHGVGVGPYLAPPAEDCEYLLDRLCQWLGGEDFDARERPELALPVAILKAVLAHLYIAWIHPFADGNGRTARLIELQILAAASVPDVACHLLSNHYNDTRTEYYRQLQAASQSGGDVLPFIEYALGGFVEGLTHHIAIVREHQQRVAWINYVHDQFRTRKTPSASRMKDLVLELSKKDAPVPRRDLPRLSPQLAVAYAGTTDKTLSRDVNALEGMGLIMKTDAGYRAMSEIILAFCPARHGQARPQLTPPAEPPSPQQSLAL
ncbi:Fic family protein [Anaeromyxobacter diazotrophicus]|uniref:Fido domain-containing protein n=1 Tax=Anaeromyxobacter diazotrophicus TaxID=2590199 RepID=A0A7I9VJC3_9BACT|nr:Fic family protein [Anaeromyxobacter diazotrophicus]GEJ56127.1 hypothetical protein AMYX_08680 [Anaeromyxobacter diazotrophicus]